MKLKQLFILALAGLAGIAGTMAAPIKIAYSDWPGYTVMEVAKQKGWFKDAGLDVEMVWFEYLPSIDAFSAGKVDGVMVVASDALVTGASGGKVGIAGGIGIAAFAATATHGDADGVGTVVRAE